ncbi:hypothetical protein [Methylobacterium sp. Leaf118]|uniref:hypothetical protein n=1 Tax=Methylobacterium sp. Leaf118 TaxID=2876562 RepID=UPI001E3108E2|nr:hypothetical protein [Methylobacterium sp. Leaf118]
MTTAAAQARHLSLQRLERAAGEAFGCTEDSEPTVASRGLFLVNSTTITFATVATALATTIGYLV